MSAPEDLVRAELRAAVHAVVPDAGVLATARARIRRRAQRRGYAAIAAVVAVVVGLSAGLTVALRPTAARTPVDLPSPTPSASPSASPSAAGPLAPFAALPGFASALVADGAAVYALYPDGARQRVARVDRRTGAVASSAALTGAHTAMTTTARAVWIDGPSGNVYRVDNSTLAIHAVHTGGQPDGLAGTPAGVWVDSGEQLLRLDPATGAIEARIATPDGFRNPTADPTGRYLYGVADPGHLQRYVVVKRDSATGAVLAESSAATALDGVGAPTLSASDQLVWAAQPTGSLGHLVALHAGDLAAATTTGVDGSNGVRGTVVDGVLWITDKASRLSCADPATGRLRATLIALHAGAPRVGPAVVGDGAGVYVATSTERSAGNGIRRITATAVARCQSAGGPAPTASATSVAITPFADLGTSPRKLALTASAVYALTPDGVARVDRASGAVVRNRRLPDSAELAVADGWVWVGLGRPHPEGPVPTGLFRLDPTDLRQRQEVVLPESPTSLVAVPAGLWVTGLSHLYLLDPTDGRIERTIALGDAGGASTAAPAGQVLYGVQAPPGATSPITVVKRDATSGAVLATTPPLQYNGADLHATDDGVWVTAPTGNLVRLILLRSGDLHQGAEFFSPRGSGEAGPQGTVVSVAAGILWVTDPFGDLYCATARTGALLATLNNAVRADRADIPSGPVVGDETTVYVATARGIGVLSWRGRCGP